MDRIVRSGPIAFKDVSFDGISKGLPGSLPQEVTTIMEQERLPAQLRTDPRRTVRAVRVSFNGHAQIRCGDEQRVARIRDVSFSGCFLEIFPPYARGANVALSFDLSPEDSHPLRANAKVTRTTETGVAVRFAYLDMVAPRALKKWIDLQKPAL